jgi:hypothetical protein
MKTEATIWDRWGASTGIWAVLFLASGYAITRTTMANPAAQDADYVRALLAERMKWEWVTLVRLVGGTLVLWFMGTLAGRLRTPDDQPVRLATAIYGLGVVWAGVWLLSGFFNSASILLATTYADPFGSRVAGVLARETPYVLSGSVMVAVLLGVSFVTFRSDQFPKMYTRGTPALAVALLFLALVDWYGAGTLGPLIVGLTLLWTAGTSVMLSSAGPRPILSARGEQ